MTDSNKLNRSDDFRNQKLPQQKELTSIINEILLLVSQAAEGKDNIDKGAAGFYGYGFVFRAYGDIDSFFPMGSYKVCSIGALRGSYERFSDAVESGVKIKNFDEINNYDGIYDLYFAGSLKTLIPTLEFGGYEQFYRVWMFVKTPDGKIFPATFYYGASGTSLGGWHSKIVKEEEEQTGKPFFPEQFKSVINFSPFDFSKKEEDEFIEALTYTLDKVPVSDFSGILEGDHGICEMGIESGEPFDRYIDDTIFEYDEVNNELKKKKLPSEGYLDLVYDFRNYVEPELKTLEPKDTYEEGVDNMADLLCGIYIGLDNHLDDLEEYSSEENYNKMRKMLEKRIGHKDIKKIVDEKLNTISKNDLELFIKRLVNIEAKYSLMTQEDKMKAIEKIKNTFKKSITPDNRIDNLIQYCFFEQLRESYVLNALQSYWEGLEKIFDL